MTTASLDVIKRLPRQTLSQIAGKAKRLGVTPETYIRQLVEDDLRFEQQARSTTLAELMGPGRDVDENELNKAVEVLKSRAS